MKFLNFNKFAETVPPHSWFGISAIFHYLGPSFAVLLFPSVGVLGIAWLRMAFATLIFAPVTHPIQTLSQSSKQIRLWLCGLGLSIAVMNTSFYLALDRLPMSVVASIEFIGIIVLAVHGLRTKRNLLALLITSIGVLVLVNLRWSSDLLGLFWVALNSVAFVSYIVIGHKLAASGATAGIARLGTAMFIATFILLPIGFKEATATFLSPLLLFAGLGVAICSSVIPYSCDQLAMSRLPRSSFALMLALLPASATIIGALVLGQFPSNQDLVGILIIIIGIAIHKPPNFA